MGLFHIHEHLPEFRNAVITIGTFDGVHEGHKTIIRYICEKAQEVNGESVLITFDPHPKQIISPDNPILLISATSEKYEEIFKIGVDHIVIIPFTRAFSLLTAEEYVHEVLIEKFQPHTIVIGYDHQFGHDRKGNIDTLRHMLLNDVEIIEIPEHLINNAHVSSTQIRQSIQNGLISLANQMLGRLYKIDGWVIHGNKKGRELGYPTANIQLKEQNIILPPTGIYVVRVMIHEDMYNGVISIGTRPTVTDDKHISYEVHILDFNEDIYGEKISIYFVERLREELKFDSIEELIHNIEQDIINAQKFF